MRPPREMIVVEDADTLAAAAASRLIARMRANDGRIAICLTGGSSPRRLYELLATTEWRGRIPWERTHWFIGDDRFVPEDGPDSNIGMARRAFLDACAAPGTLHPIRTDLASPDAAALDYEQTLKTFYGRASLDLTRPLFDLVLMGIGPDGHTASLFPGYPATQESKRWVVGVAKAPVAPFVPRVTLTFPALASCREMLFLVSGTEKRAIVDHVLHDDTLPAARARANGETVWLMDRAAAPGQTMADAGNLCAVVMMGVSGSGKSTIAESLAKRLGWIFEDGDRFHPKSNVEKMSAGHPLTDADRAPWLRAIADEIDHSCKNGDHLVIACSALKRAYRDILVHGRDDVKIVYLEGSKAMIAARLTQRKDHFMPAGLLDSQFAALEEPAPDEQAVTVSIDAPVEAVVDDIVRKLKRAGEDAGR